MYGISLYPNMNNLDRVLHSFTERLYRLGAANPLTIVLEFRHSGEGIQRPWPLFSEVGVLVEDYSGREVERYV